MELLAGRRCHNALNALHSLLYFAPEYGERLVGAGLRPGQMCYFAGRAAPLGPTGPGVVAATFYNFNPAVIARHVPRAWTLADPSAILAARWSAADAALRRLLGDDALASPELAEAARLATRASEACGAEARPLYAANAQLTPPAEPHLVLWHAATLLREHRGDGHIAVLAGAELDGIEALVSHTATGAGFTADFARTFRGWSDAEWAAAVERLRGRGLLDAEGALTAAGAALREGIEHDTDRLARAPYEHLGDDDLARLTELAATLRRRALAAGAFPDGVFAPRR